MWSVVIQVLSVVLTNILMCIKFILNGTRSPTFSIWFNKSSTWWMTCWKRETTGGPLGPLGLKFGSMNLPKVRCAKASPGITVQGRLWCGSWWVWNPVKLTASQSPWKIRPKLKRKVVWVSLCLTKFSFAVRFREDSWDEQFIPTLKLGVETIPAFQVYHILHQ